jgi:hypothetical protein
MGLASLRAACFMALAGNMKRGNLGKNRRSPYFFIIKIYSLSGLPRCSIPPNGMNRSARNDGVTALYMYIIKK